ncbi:unnamed protein product [Allacma fusca]|uniref:Uncharacterized protein n=1 Tax=Allacma fusca TaxID=39272 RepID=A0A8J2K3E2_9HEXA|nr:unnamed protein product [Allacma fusca]
MYCFVTAAAEHTDLSFEALESWKSQGSSVLQKYLQSCKPLCTRNGAFGYIDKRIMLTLWTIIIENAVTLIVGNRHK